MRHPPPSFQGQGPFLAPSLYRSMLAGWWIVALLGLVAGITTYLLERQADEVYESIGRFVVAPASTLADDARVLDSLQTLDRRSPILTLSEMIETGPFFEQAASDLSMTLEARTAYAVDAVVLPETNVVRVAVTGSDPQTVADLLNGIAEIAGDSFEGLYTVFEVAVLEPAIASQTPIEPQPVRSAGIAAVLAGGVGALIAIARDRRRAASANSSHRSGVGPAPAV